MDRYNIRQDLVVRWTLLYSNKMPFPLSAYTYRMKYITGRGENPIPASDIKVDGNVVTWSFKAEHQIASGSYNLCIEFFLGDQFVTSIFKKDAFALGCHGDGSGVVEITGYADHMYTAYRLAMDAAERVPAIDDHLDLESKNPVMNKTITEVLMSYYVFSFSASYSGVRGGSGAVTFSWSLTFNGKTITPDAAPKFYTNPDYTGEITSGTVIQMPNATRTFYAEIFVLGKRYRQSASVGAYYPIWYGFTTYGNSTFGESGQLTSFVSSSAVTARNGRIYSMTNNSDSTPYFIIAVPAGVGVPSYFYNIGSQANFSKIEGYVFKGVSCTLFYIGTYRAGARLDITAE